MSAGFGCTCPREVRPLGLLDGVNMGRGIVRLSTTMGCPVHDACAGFTAALRKGEANGYWLQCPIHHSRPCPPAEEET